jgi:DHA1 family bicyclomycin/chloramphenicol resistance-like MFS transporter
MNIGVEQQKTNHKLVIVILGALMTVSPFSIDMYLPAFSNIASDFGSTTAKVSLSLASYFVGVAIGQMIYGPLLDRYGRKTPLYYGLFVFIASSIGCALSQSVELLVAFRFVQALGASVALVAAMAMVRDFFPVEESARIFSLLILILGVSPLLAPTAGSFIVDAFGWRWVFYTLCIIVLLLMAAVFFFLPEKYKADPTVSLKAGPMLATFWEILKNRQFITYTLAGAFAFANLFIYLAGSPAIFMEKYGLSPKMYSAIFALLSVGFIGSNQVNILLLKKYKSEEIFRVAMICLVLINLVFLLGAYNNWFGVASTIVMFFLSLSCLGLIYPNSSALALSPFSRNIGSASALIGSLQIGVAGLISVGVGLFKQIDILPVAAMMAIVSFVALLVLIAGRRKSVVGSLQ